MKLFCLLWLWHFKSHYAPGESWFDKLCGGRGASSSFGRLPPIQGLLIEPKLASVDGLETISHMGFMDDHPTAESVVATIRLLGCDK